MSGSERYSRTSTSRIPAAERTLVDVYMPASWPLGLSRKVADWVRARRRRGGFRRLLKLDDHLLQDLGCSRQEVLRGAGLPEENDAPAEIERSRIRRTRWKR